MCGGRGKVRLSYHTLEVLFSLTKLQLAITSMCVKIIQIICSLMIGKVTDSTNVSQCTVIAYSCLSNQY